MSINIAIDGPAGAGKSTIARKVADKLSFIYIDTGALYRALALCFLRLDIQADDVKKVNTVCENADVGISFCNGVQHVILNGEDVTKLLRTEEVGNMASVISVIPEVRNKLLDVQREVASKSNVVMDGRDIGTRILPNAQVKIFLTAGVNERAERRFLELSQKGIHCDRDDIRKDIAERDHRDSTRKCAPLKKAEDAVLVDSSDLSIDEVVSLVLDIYLKKCGTDQARNM